MHNIKRFLYTIPGLTLFIARVLPHPANMTPLTALILLRPNQKQKTYTASLIVGFVAADGLLATLYGFSTFGVWTIFTYSGLIVMILAREALKRMPYRLLPLWRSTLVFSLGYWLWTNFGVWLTSGMYSYHLRDLVHCYTLALPFLGLQWIGDSLCVCIGFWCKKIAVNRKESYYEPSRNNAA